MQKSPAVRAMFVNTNMQKQHGLLRGGILWLIMHARGMSDTKLQALGKSHSQHGLNVHPSFYALWLDALMESVALHDPEFSAELELIWRKTLQPSIDVIVSFYDKD